MNPDFGKKNCLTNPNTSDALTDSDSMNHVLANSTLLNSAQNQNIVW